MTVELIAVCLNCPDVATLATFYRNLTGWEVSHQDADYIALRPPDSRYGGIDIQRSELGPSETWPPSPHSLGTSVHLDLGAPSRQEVDDLVAHALELGAHRPDTQYGTSGTEGYWVTLIDPAGHPFCIVKW